MKHNKVSIKGKEYDVDNKLVKVYYDQAWRTIEADERGNEYIFHNGETIYLDDSTPSLSSEERVQDSEPSNEQKAKEAIEALLKGDWDNPYLDVLGALWPDPDKNIKEICAHYGVELSKLEFPANPENKNEEAMVGQAEENWLVTKKPVESNLTGRWELGIFTPDKMNLICDVYGSTKEECTERAGRIASLPSLIKELSRLREERHDFAKRLLKSVSNEQQQHKDIQDFKRLAKIAQEDLEFLLKEAQPGSYRASFTIAELNIIINHE